LIVGGSLQAGWMNRQKKACSLSGYQGQYAGKDYEGNLPACRRQGRAFYTKSLAYKVKTEMVRCIRGSRICPQ